MTTGMYRLLMCVFAGLNLFFTFGVIIPSLVNSHNDGAIILAIVLGIGMPVTLYIGLRKVWKKEITE